MVDEFVQLEIVAPLVPHPKIPPIADLEKANVSTEIAPPDFIPEIDIVPPSAQPQMPPKNDSAAISVPIVVLVIFDLHMASPLIVNSAFVFPIIPPQ